jgi:orotidine-5'-phosphate decarboxylase
MNFQQKLNEAIDTNNSLLSVGLDPVLDRLPNHLQKSKHPFFEFNKAIIDATHDLVCTFKPNSAFYEALGHEGIEELRMTCDYLKISHPNIVILLDAKRGDIESTNEAYAKFSFDYLEADALTIQPYFGKVANMPFFERKEKGILVLCHTSNKGADEFQSMKVDGTELYKKVAENVAKEWNEYGNCGVVVGATYPEELIETRKIVGDMVVLAPGVGAQEGMLEKTVRLGVNSQKKGLIINGSRSIIYASSGKDFAEAARKEAQKLRDSINNYR